MGKLEEYPIIIVLEIFDKSTSLLMEEIELKGISQAELEAVLGLPKDSLATGDSSEVPASKFDDLITRLNLSGLPPENDYFVSLARKIC